MTKLTDPQKLRFRQQATLILAQHDAGRKLEPQALTWARNWAFPVRNDKPQGKTS
jgi:hypothetical protein